MKKMAGGGPTGAFEKKFGKNLEKAKYQEKFGGKKMASGGAVASIGNNSSKPSKSDMSDLMTEKGRVTRGNGAATKGLKSYGPMG